MFVLDTSGCMLLQPRELRSVKMYFFLDLFKSILVRASCTNTSCGDAHCLSFSFVRFAPSGAAVRASISLSLSAVALGRAFE